MEAEIHAILVDAVSEPTAPEGLFTALLDRFGDIRGVELEHRRARRGSGGRPLCVLILDTNLVALMVDG